MSESLRNDGRVWIPKQLDDTRSPDQIPDDDRDYFLERRYPAFGNLVPRDVASRAIKTRGRRRARRRAAEERRLPRLRRVDRAPRPRRHRGALRQPLRDVRAHHRREPVQGPDAHLPRHPLHDGRALGRLQPHEQRARALRARRGELRRPGRQPPRRERAHAGPRRRLLRAAVDDLRLPRAAARHRSRSRPTTRRSARPRPTVADQTRRLLSINGKHSVDHFHRELGNILWDNCGMARSQQTPREGAHRDPGAPRGVLRRRAVLGERGDAQPVAREGRPRRRLPRVRRAALPRRAHPRGVVRRSPPGRAPDRGRRGAARRRQLLARRRVGVRPASATRRRSTRSRSSSSTSTSPSAATSRRKGARSHHGSQAPRLAPGRHRRTRARSRTSTPRDISPEMSFLEMFDVRQRPAGRRGPRADRLRPRLPRGHLRLVLDDDQRPGPRPVGGHRHLPAAHAQVPRRRRDRRRAVAGPGVPDHPRPRRRPQRVRPHRRGRRLHHRADRQRARRQPDPRAQGGRRRGDGRRRVHRLRRVRGRVPERRRPAVHRGEGRAPRPAAPGPARALRRGSSTWSR